jgi:hypothetical protein
MRKQRALIFVVLVWAGSLSSLGCDHQRQELPPGSSPAGKPIPGRQEGSKVTSREIKELATGNNAIFGSFVLIARDLETYDALKAASPGLPQQSAEFFATNIVVAAFLGQRRTGGYSVEIILGSDGSLRIVEHSPAKGAMVKMSLSAPFKIVAMPVDPDQPVALTLDETWKKALRSYRITSGELVITGGFAGVHQKRVLEGSIGIMRAGELATLVFDLRSQGGQEMKQLNDAGSCVVQMGQVSLSRLNSSILTGAVDSPFQITGAFQNDERELKLSLQTINAPQVSDNFTATGQLTAVASDPSSRKIE